MEWGMGAQYMSIVLTFQSLLPISRKNSRFNDKDNVESWRKGLTGRETRTGINADILEGDFGDDGSAI
jgi:hypothetical protein